MNASASTLFTRSPGFLSHLAARLGAGSAGEHRLRVDVVGVLRPRLGLAVGVDTAPPALDPHQKRRTPEAGQIDVDGDGYAATSTTGSSPDCDDSDATINPGEPETVGDAIDNNCDGFVDDGPALNETDLPEEADFCRLQSPWAMTVSANATSPMVFGLLYEVGVTDSSGADPAVRAELGYGPQGSDPRSFPGWHYTGAAFRGDVNNADEYEASFVTPSSPGTYGYVYRFSLNHGATYTYCDIDGAGSSPGSDFQVAELGSMTVDV